MTVPLKLTGATPLEALERVSGFSRDVYAELVTRHGDDFPADVRSAIERVVASLVDLRSAVSAAQQPRSAPVTPAASNTPPKSP